MNPKSHARDTGRSEITLKVEFRVPGAPPQQGKTRDLSVRGAFVETPYPPKEGTALDLVLAPPTAWDPIAIRCTVQRRQLAPTAAGEGSPPASDESGANDESFELGTQGERRSGFGVQFENLERTHATAIRALLAASGYDDA